MATRNTRSTAFVGTELKINVSIDPIGGLTMEDYDFIIEMYCSPKKVVTIKKDDAIKLDSSNYIARVDSNITGAGDLKCKVTAYIPDSDFDDSLRTEVALIDTNITITKS